MKKILVTGATGFIGSNLTRVLIENGYEAHIITRSSKLGWGMKEISKNIKVHVADLQNPDAEKLIRKIKPNIVFHLAARGSLPEDSSASEIFSANVGGTRNLIKALLPMELELFVNTGTSGEYGIQAKAMDEEKLPMPINDYSISKLAQTMYVRKEAIVHSFPAVTLRLFSVYGPFEESTRLMPTVVRVMVDKKKEISLSSPDFVRDFVYVGDVVEAFLASLKLKLRKGQIYNIGSGKQHAIGDVVRIAKEETGFSGKILWNKIPKQSRQIEPKVWQADISKANIELGWKPKTSLEKGISETIEWYKNYKQIN